MDVTLGGCSFVYPTTPEGLTIGRWIQYMQGDGAALDQWAATIELQPESVRKALDRQALLVERAYSLAAFFSACDAKATFPLSDTVDLYYQFFQNVFQQSKEPWALEGVMWYLPAPQLQPHDGITFGEFIDSKVIVQASKAQELSDWDILLKLSAIWLRRDGEPYNETMLLEDSERIALLADKLPMGQVKQVGGWWEDFNKYCEKHFQIFHPSQVKGGRFTKAHFERWGWVNFLKGIAKTKVFDIPGLNQNSIECARLASAYDVLVFASEEKDLGEAQYLDMKESSSK